VTRDLALSVRPTPNRLRAIPNVARCACGEIVIASELRPHELRWCGECRGFVDEVLRASQAGATMPALPQGGMDLAAHLIEIEVSLIRRALDETGSIYAASKLLGLKRTTLSEKVRKYAPGDPELASYRGERFGRRKGKP
jgi:transcriptional regulator with GAF, ATPase, and Fis domain